MINPSQTIKEISAELPEGVRLVAVSKYHPASLIKDAYNGGQRIFGESRVQELQEKYDILPKDIEWHFIGHLQTNKVKYLAPYVSMIHAIDSHHLLCEVNRRAAENGRTIDCLLQLHVAHEETKFGFSRQELIDYLEKGEWRQLHSVHICGLMCMASNVDDGSQIEAEFALAYNTYKEIKDKYFAKDPSFCERSWGMSHDYKIALRNGSTLIRVGSKIFGERVY